MLISFFCSTRMLELIPVCVWLQLFATYLVILKLLRISTSTIREDEPILTSIFHANVVALTRNLNRQRVFF